MLEADRPVAEYQQWFAGNFEITVRERDRRFLMRAGEKFRFLVAAVVDQRFMQPTKTLRGIARDVIDIERLDDIDHEVGVRRAFGLH